MDRGAHYHHCDFQVHTPRDLNWTGGRPTAEAERVAFAESLLTACRAQGLHAIGVTDHHDMAFAKVIRRAALAERRHDGSELPDDERIVVFPGMELTLAVPCQALVLFDADFPEEFFAIAMTALAIHPADDAEERHADVRRLENITTIQSLYSELDKHSVLAGRYIVLPNIGEGATSLLRKGHGPHYKQMPCVGGYVDGSFGRLGVGNRNIIDGIAAEYGNKKLAVFQTSDNRQADFGRLGTHSTWVKWAVPTAEALRQACLARKSRISHEAPALANIWITSVEVSNSRFMGPVALEVNPQYSALIGSRVPANRRFWNIYGGDYVISPHP